MNTAEALTLVGGLSKPSKMPGWAYGLPAKECNTIVMHSRVVMYLKLYKKHNTED